ncbi:hypothetical protein F0344_00560 [Streptomyces finlayi]|uniref:Uncharacterized protein n=1 Tax=Streptomyces finlayi TaxID=67296 RepID=A0A7G7BD99_9ACTN|nr:hypothetical protein [Streptomyces finlayi]QNE73314.1 hypothetical protein F0344_00560 [Streptomyces finlayi]
MLDGLDAVDWHVLEPGRLDRSATDVSKEDDPGESHLFDGTVGGHARWALTRIGDPRARCRTSSSARRAVPGHTGLGLLPR